MSPSTPLPKDAGALHFRIGRIVVEAPAGTDRHALARTLAQQLPSAIGERLRAGASAPPGSLSQHIAAAVAARVRSGGHGR